MANYEELKKKIDEEIAKNHEELIALNDDLADHPETSGKEFETSEKIVKLLRNHGYEVEYPFAGLETAFKGTFGKGGHKHKVAILTEYDALPDIGHACGHCVSGSISILAALATKDIQDELDCDIHIIGTPNEEMDGAKCHMTDNHIFDDYEMTMMIHLYDQNLLTCNLLALEGRTYRFFGKAAHGASAPWEGVNALNAAQLFMHAIDCMRQHVTPDVRMHGIYSNGGAAPNIVPEEAEVRLYTRAMDKYYLEGLNERVIKMAEGACLMTGATFEWGVTEHPYDNMQVIPEGLKALGEVYDELGIDLNGDTTKLFGSSDVGNVSFVCPTFHTTLQLVERGIAIHTRDFEAAVKTDHAHELIATGAKVIAYQIAKVTSDESRINKMMSEFKALAR